ncbi:hypothetical protein [Paraclostridium bifermentans]|uniref:hypothetical protein n=1 Tax=Paraclostridium bifermentans TaxID=1490 RepID=UPI00359C4871
MKIINGVYSLSQGIFGSVRKVIALCLTIVFCYLSIIGTIKPGEFIPIFSMVLGYYFGKSTALDTPKQLKEQDMTINGIKYEELKE